MTAPVQDAILLLGDSLTEFGWGEGGLATRLAGEYLRTCNGDRAHRLSIWSPGSAGKN